MDMYGLKFLFNSLVNSSCTDGYVCMDGCVVLVKIL
jgi:hypothetical protein